MLLHYHEDYVMKASGRSKKMDDDIIFTPTQCFIALVRMASWSPIHVVITRGKRNGGAFQKISPKKNLQSKDKKEGM